MGISRISVHVMVAGELTHKRFFSIIYTILIPWYTANSLAVNMFHKTVLHLFAVYQGIGGLPPMSKRYTVESISF
jgi:hypothetical protein